MSRFQRGDVVVRRPKDITQYWRDLCNVHNTLAGGAYVVVHTTEDGFMSVCPINEYPITRHTRIFRDVMCYKFERFTESSKLDLGSWL